MPEIQLTAAEVDMLIYSAISLLFLGWLFRQIYKLVK
jgi:hypothetical protein